MKYSMAAIFSVFFGALQGAAVTLAELGEYSQASTLLEDLTKVCSHSLLLDL